MLVFEVKLNGKKVCNAGLDEPGVVSAILTWVLGDGRHKPKGEERLKIDVGGMVSESGSFIRWFCRPLKRGDRVQIRLLESASADEPSDVQTPPAKALREDERRQKKYVRRMAKEWGWKIEIPKRSGQTRTKKQK